ncbi:8-amino-7-oxononanoate synthase [Shewanella putrefaciens]|nr:8-amino-7-oxononanoate synthase [Shewanella putrefaciens]
MSFQLDAKIAARQQALFEQGLLRQRKALCTDALCTDSIGDLSPRFLFEGVAILISAATII